VVRVAEQALDVRTVVATLRRHRMVLASAAVVGALSAVTLAVVASPDYTSVSQVLLPPAQGEEGQVERDVATELKVARSDVVLGAVARELQPPMSARGLGQQVQVSAPTRDILEFSVSTADAGRARDIAQALAEREVGYVQEATSSLDSARRAALEERAFALRESLDTVAAEISATKTRIDAGDPTTTAGQADATALAQLTAEQASLVLQHDQVKSQLGGSTPGGAAIVIQPATAGQRPGVLRAYALVGVLGAVLATVLVALFLFARARRDKRLRYRDELADAVGSPVVASVHTSVPRNVAGWLSLLADYQPGQVNAWALRQALRELHLRTTARAPGSEDRPVQRLPHPRSLTVISLADDRRALAVGPQLASYAASAGVPTGLVIGTRHESADPLWAACGSGGSGGELRPLLRLHDGVTAEERPDDFTVVLVVVDRRDPVLPDGLDRTGACVLAVAAGAASAEDLARVAVKVDDAGMRIDALVVADPDDLDRTTGRLLRRERDQQAALPARLTGQPLGPGSKVSRLRARRS
jgi:capsular polysaccharide biosynthesis protein